MIRSRHILVPVHDSRSSRSALRQARIFADATGAPLRILEVRPLQAREVEPLAFDGGTLAGVIDGGPEVTSPVADVRVVEGDPLQVILAEAADPDVQLLVIGHGERGWLARGLTAPLHERVVRWCRCPVMVVHADVEPPAGSSPPGGELSSPPSGSHLRLVQ